MTKRLQQHHVLRQPEFHFPRGRDDECPLHISASLSPSDTHPRKQQQQQQFFSLTQRSCVIGVWVRGAVRGCGLANRQRDNGTTDGGSSHFFLFSFLFLFFGGRRRFSSVVSPSNTDERRTIAHSFFLHLIFHRNSQLPAVERLGCFDSTFSANPGQSGEPSWLWRWDNGSL